ncbi:MAG: DUF489 family protein [Pseudomonadota bacterium]
MFFKQPTSDETLALAGVLQASQIADRVATSSDYDRDTLHESMHSLLRIDSPDAESVFGSRRGVINGLGLITQLFGKTASARNRLLLQYAINMHQLAGKLRLQPRFAASMSEQLNAIADRYPDSYGDQSFDEEICVELADLYSETISQMSPRIMVQGEPSRLQQPDVAQKIRTALFAGIRSAFLWDQLGGRKWHLLFYRTHYVRLSRKLMVHGV